MYGNDSLIYYVCMYVCTNVRMYVCTYVRMFVLYLHNVFVRTVFIEFKNLPCVFCIVVAA